MSWRTSLTSYSEPQKKRECLTMYVALSATRDANKIPKQQNNGRTGTCRGIRTVVSVTVGALRFNPQTAGCLNRTPSGAKTVKITARVHSLKHGQPLRSSEGFWGLSHCAHPARGMRSDIPFNENFRITSKKLFQESIRNLRSDTSPNA